MPSPSDPIRSARRNLIALAAVSAIVAAPIMWWACEPLSRAGAPQQTALDHSRPIAPAMSPSRPSLDTDIFNVTLWNAPSSSGIADAAPKPAASPPQPSTTPALPPRPTIAPLRLQLIGIIRDSNESDRDSLRAAVYDPDKDTLLVVSAGQTIGTRRVDAIDSLGITFVDVGNAGSIAEGENEMGVGARTRLLLRTESAASPAGSSPITLKATNEPRAGTLSSPSPGKPGGTP